MFLLELDPVKQIAKELAGIHDPDADADITNTAYLYGYYRELSTIMTEICHDYTCMDHWIRHISVRFSHTVKDLVVGLLEYLSVCFDFSTIRGVNILDGYGNLAVS